MSRNVFNKSTDPNAYNIIKNVIETMPDLGSASLRDRDVMMWLGRASSIVEDYGTPIDGVSFRVAADNLDGPIKDKNSNTIQMVLYRCLAASEKHAPLEVRGSFVPVGASFDILNTFSDIFKTAKQSVMIVDPYFDAPSLRKYVTLIPEGVEIKILTTKGKGSEELILAFEAWVSQYKTKRPLHAKLCTKKSLHDRMFILDGTTVWTFGQSLNAIADRSPTSIIKLDNEVGELKIEAYNEIWNASVDACKT